MGEKDLGRRDEKRGESRASDKIETLTNLTEGAREEASAKRGGVMILRGTPLELRVFVVDLLTLAREGENDTYWRSGKKKGSRRGIDKGIHRQKSGRLLRRGNGAGFPIKTTVAERGIPFQVFLGEGQKGSGKKIGRGGETFVKENRRCKRRNMQTKI